MMKNNEMMNVTTPFLFYFLTHSDDEHLPFTLCLLLSNEQCFCIVLSFDQTIEQCTCIVLFCLLTNDLIEQWFTIVLSF